ncbi:MAG: carboxypeptidase-like regulatory domain-containing protein [Planctomycetia bacterium]|nr:carboxypeptidase-like regulatory domain-containing protein [Planctomycetia bacterium]
MKNHFFRTLLCLLTILLVTAAIGCKKARVYVPVTGTLTLDGKPIAGATVSFLPVAPDGTAAAGRTDASGTFSLSSGPDAGCVVGDYQVSCTKVETKNVPDPKAAGIINMKTVATKNELPPKYADASVSGLTVTVKKGMEPVKLELTK